jgi:nucleotide-binding universal stress UspA family protein
MNKILIATDGSASAREAVEFGLELAVEQQADVTFAYAVPAYDTVPTTLSFGVTGALPHERCAADRQPLEEAVRLAEGKGVHARSALLVGKPVDEIVAYADSIDADVIVLGSRGHGAIASALLGSVSRGVLHETRRQVLVVRGTETHVDAPLAIVR